LRLISVTSSYFSIAATVEALQLAKKLGDVDAYLEIAENLHKLGLSEKDVASHPRDVQAAPDTAWVERRQKQLQAETDRLEAELKVYRNNMIKESIRMGQEDLGKHYYESGDFASASKAFGKMRDYCTTNKHIADMTLKLLFVNIAARSWNAVPTFCTKLVTVQLPPGELERTADISHVGHALTALATGSYWRAAHDFLKVSPNYINMEPVANVNFQRAVISPNDIAVYGGLCALATMDRAQLQKQVLNNSNFRTFLELEPHIRRSISAFVQGKYPMCLEILGAYYTDYMLDIYLNSHFDEIVSLVRSKSIVAYFAPFSAVTIEELSRAFPARHAQPIEDELIDLIKRGMLNARIDLVDKLLVAPKVVPRNKVHTEAVTMARDYEKALRLRLLNINMTAAGMEVPVSKNNSGQQSAAMDLMGQENFGRSGGFGRATKSNRVGRRLGG
jgi:COP9 signalosome complex subunit 1